MDNPYQENPGPYAWDNPGEDSNFPPYGMVPPVTLPRLSAALIPITEPAAPFACQNEGPVDNPICGEIFTTGHEPLSAGNTRPFTGTGSSLSSPSAPMAGPPENFTGLVASSTNSAHRVNTEVNYHDQIGQPIAEATPYPFMAGENINQTWYHENQGASEPILAANNLQHVMPPADMGTSGYHQYGVDLKGPSNAALSHFRVGGGWRGPDMQTDRFKGREGQMERISNVYPEMVPQPDMEPYRAYIAAASDEQRMALWFDMIRGRGQLPDLPSVTVTAQDEQTVPLFDMGVHRSNSFSVSRSAPNPENPTWVDETRWLREVINGNHIRLELIYPGLVPSEDAKKIWFRAADSLEYWEMGAERPPIGQAPPPNLRFGDLVIEFTEATVGLLIKAYEDLKSIKGELSQRWIDNNPDRRMWYGWYPHEASCTSCAMCNQCKGKAGKELRVIVFSDAHYSRDGVHKNPNRKGNCMTKKLLIARVELEQEHNRGVANYWDVGEGRWVDKQPLDVVFDQVEGIYMQLGNVLNGLRESDWQMLHGDIPGHHATVQQAKSTGKSPGGQVALADGSSLGARGKPKLERNKGPARVARKSPVVHPANRPKRAASPPAPPVKPPAKKRAVATQVKEEDTGNARTTQLPPVRPADSGSTE